MPSSSNKETDQERMSLYYFKLGFVKFFHHGFHKEAQQVCEIYSNLLELDKQMIIDMIMEDKDEWENMKTKAQKERRSNSVWKASNSLSDTAGILFQYGREDEGQQFCVHAAQVQIMAENIQADEEHNK